MPIIGIGAGGFNLTGSILQASGSVGNNFASMSFENTASLGLSGSISIYSASIAEVINDTTASYDFARHTENSLKFITAKVYENTDKITKAYTDNQRYFGRNIFVNPVRADVIGNSSTSTILETARTIGGVSFNGSANINLPGVNTAGNQNTTGTATTATTATNINALANNTTNESTYITFVDGATGTQRIETDTGLRYNPSSNLISSTITNAHSASYSKGHKGYSPSNYPMVYWVTPTHFQHVRGDLRFAIGNFRLNAREAAVATVWLPAGSGIYKQAVKVNCGALQIGTINVYMHTNIASPGNPALLASGNINTDIAMMGVGNVSKNFNAQSMFLTIQVTAGNDAAIEVYSGEIDYIQK